MFSLLLSFFIDQVCILNTNFKYKQLNLKQRRNVYNYSCIDMCVCACAIKTDVKRAPSILNPSFLF